MSNFTNALYHLDCYHRVPVTIGRAQKLIVDPVALFALNFPLLLSARASQGIAVYIYIYP